MRHPVIAIAACAVVAFAGAALLRGPTGSDSEDGNGRRLASRPALSDFQPKDGDPSSDLAYRFERKIQAEVGKEEIVNLSMKGKITLKPALSGGGMEFLVRIDAPEPFYGSPRVRIRLNDAKAVTSVELGIDDAKSGIDPVMMGRFAVDVVDQYLFHENHDLQGRYEAKVEPLGASKFSKKKLRYLDKPYADGELRDSAHSLELADDGFSKLIQGSETFVLGDGKTPFKSATQYRIERDPLPFPETVDLASLDWRSIALPSPASQLVSETALSLYGIPSLTDLLTSLRSDGLKTAAERLGLFRKLVKRLDREPSKTEEARAALKDVAAAPDRVPILIGALATSSRAEPQALLREVFADPSTPDSSRQAVMNAWTTTEAELPGETIRLLKDLGAKTGTPGASAANLALGAQVARTRDPKARADLETLLVARLQQAKGSSDKALALDMIGNSGSGKLAPYVRDYLPDPDDHVRARAYLALRRMPGDDIRRAIEAGKTDASDEVRRSVRLALTLRTEAPQ